ncbi:MAG TPA: CoA transferase [Methylomirabilota bacterium]|nr:CoA transferase [Methylomirabilota bacterium]
MVKPLSGVVVLDLTRFLAGPYCAMLLGGLGAEVIKVEAPAGEESFRDRPPYGGPKGASFKKQTPDDISLSILHRNRNKKSITLNLRRPEGKELFLRLCEKTDIVVENYAAGTMERMGLAYSVLQSRNPRLILCSISGFGQTGPRRAWRAYDPIIQAAAGIVSITGYADRPPVRAGAAISDTTTPLVGVIGVLAALQLREKTGKGEWVDISMQDSSFFLLPEIIEFMLAGDEPQRLANAHVSGAPFNIYEAKDGYVSICAASAPDWRKLVTALGKPELEKDPRFSNVLKRREHREEVDAIIQAWVSQHTVAEAVAYLQQRGVPAGPILTPQELMTDEHLAARNMVIDLEHPLHGPIPGAKALGIPVKFVNNPVQFDQPAPALGQHNEEIYERFLGLDRVKLAELREQGVI